MPRPFSCITMCIFFRCGKKKTQMVILYCRSLLTNVHTHTGRILTLLLTEFWAVVFSFWSNTVKRNHCSWRCWIIQHKTSHSHLSDFGESLLAFVNEEFWPVDQVCTDLITVNIFIILLYDCSNVFMANTMLDEVNVIHSYLFKCSFVILWQFYSLPHLHRLVCSFYCLHIQVNLSYGYTFV